MTEMMSTAVDRFFFGLCFGLGFGVAGAIAALIVQLFQHFHQ